MHKITHKIAKRIKLHYEDKKNGVCGMTLEEFIDESNIRYGFSISQYNVKLRECGFKRVTAQEVEKAAAKKETYVLVPYEDMLLITAVVDSYEARNPFPPSNPNHNRIKEVCGMLHEGKFKLIKK